MLEPKKTFLDLLLHSLLDVIKGLTGLNIGDVGVNSGLEASMNSVGGRKPVGVLRRAGQTLLGCYKSNRHPSEMAFFIQSLSLHIPLSGLNA
jgi:hypothetical protein